jgi:WD40 repeat protein/tRNA A-37 threonylcarbamoyl transferase component Bud32
MSEETIFETALEKPSVAERAAYLAEACGSDAALRQRIEGLLAAHQVAGEFLDRPAVEQMTGGLGKQGSQTEPMGPLLADESFRAAEPAGAQAEQGVAAGDREWLSLLSPPGGPGSLGRLRHYDVLAVIGRGGMGIVLKALDEVLKRIVAIKVMSPTLAAMASARKRFIREAQAAAAVRDDHVVNIHAVEELKGLPYLVMEYVGGISLQERLDRSGLLELKEILRIGMQTAAGLAAAHKQGLIHRDIKPANILLENGVQRVKITDFGLARAMDDASETQSGVVAGTPQYMAPEQARGEPVDHRSDLFSLGSLLYAMCTGHPPYRASTTLGVLRRVSEESPPPVQQVNSEIPTWLAAIIEKLHRRDPAERFQSAAEVAELLGRHLAHLQQPGAVPAPGTLRLPAVRRAGLRRWAVAAAALLLACAGLGLSDATGVTRVGEYVATVLRIHTPEGTLVVELNDPNVQVTIAGGGDELVITGSGPQELRLRPGRYQLHASKDGVPLRLDQELVTITRGGKQIVRVSHEAPAPAVAVESADRGKTSFPIKLLATLRGEGTFTRLAFSPDGRLLASSHDGGRLVLWDVAAARVKRTIQAHNLLATGVTFSPDGKQLASVSGDSRVPFTNGEIKLWDPATGKLRLTLPSSTGGLYAVAFAPDGRTVAATGVRGTVYLWDTATGVKRGTLKGPTSTSLSLAYSPDGKLLAQGLMDVVQIWDLARHERIAQLQGHQDEVECVSFSPDGKTLATGSRDRTARLWDMKSFRERAILKGHRGWVRSLAFSPDGKMLASGCWEHMAKLWDAASGRELLEVPQPGIRAGSSVAFSRDCKTLAVGGNANIRLWDISELEQKNETP